MSLLSVESVFGGYGGVDILNGMSMTVEDGQIVVIVGPNGAGKSTLMKAIFGLVSVHTGQIMLAGNAITNMGADRLVPLGLSYVPQERNVFPTLTVQENWRWGPIQGATTTRTTSKRCTRLFRR